MRGCVLWLTKDIPASSVDLTGTDGRYFTCDPDEKTPRQALASYDILCGVCECSNLFQRSHLLKSLRSERAKDLMPPGQESLMIIVDYKTTTLRTNPSISVARKVCEQPALELADHTHHSQVLTILQQHYVETLGRAIVVNLPPLLNFFYKGISPFLDPVTRDKVGVYFSTVIEWLKVPI